MMKTSDCGSTGRRFWRCKRLLKNNLKVCHLVPTCETPLNFLSKNFAMKHILVLLRDSSRKSKKPSHNLTFWLAFSVFDPRKLPENLEVEDSYGEEEIHKLISWYGVQKSDTYEDKTTSKKEDLEAEKFRAEWPGFLHLMHERCIMDQKKHRH